MYMHLDFMLGGKKKAQCGNTGPDSLQNITTLEISYAQDKFNKEVYALCVSI